MTNCGPTKSQNPCGRCLNKEFILKSFAANTICMDHFASLVPNHKYGCGTNFCFRELSVIIILTVREKNRSHKILLALRCNIMINHMSLNFLCRRLPWLWSGSHTSRLAQLIGVFLVVRVIEDSGLFCDIACWILRSYRLKPGRLKGSHPMILTNPSVSMIAPQSLASTAALFFVLIP